MVDQLVHEGDCARCRFKILAEALTSAKIPEIKRHTQIQGVAPAEQDRHLGMQQGEITQIFKVCRRCVGEMRDGCFKERVTHLLERAFRASHQTAVGFWLVCYGFWCVYVIVLRDMEDFPGLAATYSPTS